MVSVKAIPETRSGEARNGPTGRSTTLCHYADTDKHYSCYIHLMFGMMNFSNNSPILSGSDNAWLRCKPRLERRSPRCVFKTRMVLAAESGNKRAWLVAD